MNLRRNRPEPSRWPPDLAEIEAALMNEGYPDDLAGPLAAWASDFALDEVMSQIRGRQEALEGRGYPPAIADAVARVEVLVGDPWGHGRPGPDEEWVEGLRSIRARLQEQT